MDYKKMDLSLSELLLFYSLIITFGSIVGWLFYDSALVSAAVICLSVYFKTPYKNYLKIKRQEELLMQFKDLLYSMSSSISVGRSIGQALIESRIFWKNTYSDSDYIMIELLEMEKKMCQSKITDIEVLEDFEKRSGLSDVSDMVLVCKTCKRTGGNMTEALTKCSNIISDKITLQRELKALLYQKKFEGRIVALSPFVIVLVIRLASPSYFLPMIETKIGIIISTISLVMIISGWVYIERVNSIEF